GNWTSFSPSAKVAGNTAGPTGGAVPKAGGAPAGGAPGVCDARRHAAAEAIRAADARFRNCLRDFDMHHIVVKSRSTRKRVPYATATNLSLRVPQIGQLSGG